MTKEKESPTVSQLDKERTYCLLQVWTTRPHHEAESQCTTSTKVLRGSNNLVTYILANNKMVIQQQRAEQQELETARFASLAETTKENETEGDDNMERPAKR